MANRNVTLKRNNAGTTEELYPTTDWAQVNNKPSTFTPTDHTHDNSDIVSTGVTDGYVLTADGSGGTAWEAAAAGSTFNGGTITNNLTISKDNPVLTLKDTGETNDLDQVGYISFRDSANVEKGWVGFGSSGNTDFTVTNGYNGDINLMGGNVGIGTASPDSKLTVNGGTSNTPARFISTDSNTNIALIDNTGAALVNGLGGALTFLTGYDANISGGSEKMRIDTDGNVGIGTTSPQRNLHILSDNEEAIRLDVTTDTGAIHFRENGTFKGLFGFSNGTSMWTGADADDMVWRSETKMHLVSNTNSHGLTVSSGNVGIGTTSPSQALDVSGNIAVSGTVDGIDISLLNSTVSTKAPLASPALTGTPTAPTAAANTNTTQIATTAYVQQEITDLIGGAPGALDTLNELAAAINDDSSYASTITTALAGKLSTSGKAADANLLDGIDSTGFLRVSANSSSPLNGNFAIGNASSRNFIQSHNSQPLDINPLGNAVTINGSSNTVWHAGNDGSGSGLSADNVDGYHIVVGSTGSDTNTLYFTT